MVDTSTPPKWYVPLVGTSRQPMMIHGGGFAGAGLTDNGHKLPLVDGQAHAVQRVNLLIAHMVDLIDVF